VLQDYDVVVVGGGVAGLGAAYRAKNRGLSVALLEPGTLGGKLQASGWGVTKALRDCVEGDFVEDARVGVVRDACISFQSFFMKI
jgi:flavin-dependent dehydrogenase